MDAFIVSARKYRPATFDTVVGQQHVTHTLKNAILNNHLAQAFLFCGPRGVGKTTCARILAKTINCTNLTPEGEACGTCPSCESFQKGQSFSVHELDAASNNSVDDIRSLIEQVRIPPQSGRYKVYIIDEVHMLSQAAFNAFLKTLEEPPSYAIFILATTEKHKILPTILSRCQIFDFNRIRVEDIAGHLEGIAVKEGIAYDQDGLHIIAQKADGGLRDALSMFDQIASFSNRNISYKAVIDNLNILDYEYFFKLTRQTLDEDVASMLMLFDEVLMNGFDGNHFISGFASHLRNLLVAQDPKTVTLLEVSEGIKQKYLGQAAETDASFLVSALNIANTCDLNYRLSKNQRLQVELALIKIAHIRAALSLQAEPAQVQLKKNTERVEKPAEPPVVQHETEKIPVKKAPPEPVPPVAAPEPSPLAEKPAKAPVAPPRISSSSIKIPTLAELSQKKPGENGTVKDEYLTGEARSEITQDRLLDVWNAYAGEVKQQNRITLFTLMTTHAPLIKPEHKIEVTVEGAYAEQIIQEEKLDLLNHLRSTLQNFALDFEITVIEPQKRKQLYTSQEKYQHMAEKNPNLAELKKRFNLDIEF
ncbi:MAG: DNA polymerase III subunit gamma/tau [Mucilaginibacter polytrichastri]|nr:DNA polymerase III subunit gamma/tau [Mucilaginibacter polytrichastri]